MSRIAARFLVASALAGAVAGALGCDVGTGKGAAAGTLFLDPCTKDTALGTSGAPVAFDLKPTYFVAAPVNDVTMLHMANRLSIRVQSVGTVLEESDVLFLNVANVSLIAKLLGQPIPVGPDTNLRATLGMNRTCPKHAVQIELDGTITFSRFGSAGSGSVPEDFRIVFGDLITASFGFDVVDRRALSLGDVGGVSSTPTVGGRLDGNFDFVVRQGRSAQIFP